MSLDSNLGGLVMRWPPSETGPPLKQPLRTIHLLATDGMCPLFADPKPLGGGFARTFDDGL
jgi:hypothetical protein